MVNQYHIHFTTQNYAGNVGLTTGDNLIQTHTIGNTEENNEHNTNNGKDSKGLRPKNRRNQIQTK